LDCLPELCCGANNDFFDDNPLNEFCLEFMAFLKSCFGLRSVL
jgi:hypothetical protein